MVPSPMHRMGLAVGAIALIWLVAACDQRSPTPPRTDSSSSSTTTTTTMPSPPASAASR